jgi:hypothetical protein
MIVNKPKPKYFERQSVQYLIQSIDLRSSNDHKDEDIKDYDVDKAEYWKYHQGILNNSLTLLFLSLENLIKKEICQISPLMLLADEPKNGAGVVPIKNLVNCLYFSLTISWLYIKSSG